MLIKAKKRGSDNFGSGAYGASRGSRKHRGIDFLIDQETEICSHVNGIVTKLGYCYGDDLSFRYVEVTTPSGFSHRFFYVEPGVGVYDTIKAGDVIGISQDLGTRYPHIPLHIHYEVVVYNDNVKTYHDPNDFI